MIMKKAEELIARADAGEGPKISRGVWLYSQKDMLTEQAGWDDDDWEKHTDFTANLYWIITDTGNLLGIDSLSELTSFLNGLWATGE